MNVEELRIAFNLSATQTERIKGFRVERTNLLTAQNENDEIPVLLSSGPMLVTHVVPMTIGDPGAIVDLSQMRSLSWPTNDLFYLVNYGRHNFDGFIMPHGRETDETPLNGYYQVFRDGAVECVEVLASDNSPDNCTIDMRSIEAWALGMIRKSILIQITLDIDSRLVVMLSLLNVQNCRCFITPNPSRPPREEGKRIHRNRFLFPDIVIERFDGDLEGLEAHLAKELKPIFDVIWNVAGWESSRSYDKDGNWVYER